MFKINDIHQIIKKLAPNYQIFAPQKSGDRLLYKELKNPKNYDYSGLIPGNTFKHILFPDGQILYEYEGTKINSPAYNEPSLVLFGLTVFDIRALDFYSHVFEKDPYFQARRRKMLVVGQSYVPAKGDGADEIEKNYENNVLEHVSFDIFIKRIDRDNFKLYTGTRQGQNILEELGLDDYEHIQFRGTVCDSEPAMTNKKNVLDTYQKKVWEKWGRLCLNCGKCTIACPTCYCFEVAAVAVGKTRGKVIRKWSSCFYTEFSKVAGGAKFLKNSADRIYNWYYHKYVRNHDEFCLVGCVGCGRCDKVCPAGIRRLDVLNSLRPHSNAK